MSGYGWSSGVWGGRGVGDAVELVEADAEGFIIPLGPLFLVEAGGVLEVLLADVEAEDFLVGLAFKGADGDGEELVALAEEAAVGEDGIVDDAGAGVEDDVLDDAQVLVLLVDDFGAD